MMSKRFPAADWEHVEATEAGFSATKLDGARVWLATNASGRPYRVVVIRGGRLVAEWNHGVDREEQLWLASAAKSIFSCMLGIAVAEGRLPSPDVRLVDVYPEALDVPEGDTQVPRWMRQSFSKTSVAACACTSVNTPN